MQLLEKDNRRYIFNLFINSFKKSSENTRQVWQRENYPVTISSEKFYIEKANYIYLNPVQKRFVELSEHWIYSFAKESLYDKVGILKMDDAWK